MRKLNFFFTALSLLLFGAQAAHAGPIIAAISAISAIPVIGNLLISLAVNAITNKIFGKPKGGAGGGVDRGILVNKQSNNEPIPVVYGRRRLGGVRVFVETSDGSGGQGTNTLNMALVLSEGQTGDIHQLFFNDTKVWDRAEGGTASGNATNGYTLGGYVDSEKYTESGALKGGGEIVYHPGHPDQVADSNLVGSSSVWSSNHRLRGVAYLAFKLTADSEVYQSGLPTMTAVIDGKKIRPATNPPGTAASGENANYADAILDYLTNTTYGKGIALSDIDLDSFASARSYMSSRFNCNGALFTGDRIFDNIQELLYTCNGMLIFTNGKYHLDVKRTGETASGKTNFNNGNIIGEVTVALPDLKTRFNGATVDFNNKLDASNYNEDVVIIEDSGYLTQDNNRKLEMSVQFPYVTDETEVTNIAQSFLDQSRNQVMIAFEAAHTVFPIAAGDIITVTLDEYNYSNKLFRVITMELTPDNTIQIAAQEYNSAALI